MTAPRKRPLAIGVAVEVRNHFEGGWSRGFHIVDAGPDGYRVARGDGTQLPVPVDPSDVRPVQSATDLDGSHSADVHATIALDLRTSEATVTIRMTGSLTRLTAAHFREVTRDVTGPSVLVDLSSVTEIDDAGTAVLLALIHRTREEHGSVIVVVTDPEVRQALHRTGVHRVAALVRRADAAAEVDELSEVETETEIVRLPGTD